MRSVAYIVFSILFFWSCQIPEPKPAVELTDFQEEAIAYSKEVALGFEFGSASPITRKWEEPMRIYVSGYAEGPLYSTLQNVRNEINSLVSDGFELELVADSLESNFHIFFGKAGDYVVRYPNQKEYVKSNYGLFSVFWNGRNEINRGHMYVDTERADSRAQHHLLREELTQSLGLAKDSDKYPDSIFQQSYTYTDEYSEMDKELIRLLYHPEMTTGLTEIEVDVLLRSIYTSENTLLQ